MARFFNLKQKGGSHRLVKVKPPRSRSAYLYNARSGVLRSTLSEAKPADDAEEDDDAYS